MAKKTMTTGEKTAIGVGAGIAVAAAAAGAYYFLGSDKAKEHRRKAAKWANDMKRDIEKEVKGVTDASPRAINAIIDRVAKTYTAAKTVDADEILRAAKELKSNWDAIQAQTKRLVKTSARKT